MRQTLRKREILRGSNKFSDAFKKGKRLHGKILRCMYTIRQNHENQSGEAGIAAGFSVSREVTRAIDRNRIKRLMREAFRLNKNWFTPKQSTTVTNVELVFLFVPRKRSSSLPAFQDIDDDMKSLLSTILQDGA